jgi:hypothetical protein
MARASMREGWRLAEESGANLITEEEIEAEIDYVRRNPERKEATASREAPKREEEVCA